MQLNNIFDNKGKHIIIGRKIGSGGEGSVYELKNDPNNVAKIYNQQPTKAKQKKINSMVLNTNDELKNISAWPTSTLHINRNGSFCGFIMPKISGFEPIHKLYTPSQRKYFFPKSDWNYLVLCARNLAVAFSIMHNNGYVIGDVNQGNVHVNKDMHVKLIDCDSYQVISNNEQFLCEVGVPHFTPPELQNSTFSRIIRTTNHDNFGLAILCFHLLFLGRHPFSGRFLDLEDIPIEKAIAEYRFVYGKNASIKKMAPPPNSANLSILPDKIAYMFELAFSEEGSRKKRPSAYEWVRSIDNELRTNMKICNFEKNHKFFSQLSYCPWCNIEQKIGIALFIGEISEDDFNINLVWNHILSVSSPGIAPKLNFHIPIKPTRIPKNIQRFVKLERYKHYIVIVQLLALSIIYLPFVILGIIIALFIELYPTPVKDEFKKRNMNLNIATMKYSEINDKWKNEAGENLFQSRLHQLEEIKKKYQIFQQQYDQEYRHLKDNDRERQLENFLRNCFIDDYKIPKIGDTRKAALRSYGIESAADIISYRIMQIPGFGETLTKELELWRENMIRKFSYNPGKGIDKADIANLKIKYRKSMKPLESQMKSGYNDLNMIKNQILLKRQKLMPEIERAATELAQAKSDIALLKKM